MFFEFDQQASITTINPRPELHGEDPKPACDIFLSALMPNTVLERFGLGMTEALYKADDQPDMVDQAEGTTGLRVLKYPAMRPFKWDFQGTGYSAEIDYGMGGESNIVLGELTVDKFKLEPQNGGSVLVSWRIIAHPSEADIGKLYNMMGRDVDLVLTPPAPKNLQEAFGDTAPAEESEEEAEA